jgi:putative nucleotidyltransferase with HDIG domain
MDVSSNANKPAAKDMSGVKTLILEFSELNETTPLIVPLEGVVDALAMLVQVRDPYTGGHQIRVARLACAIARQMDLSQECIEWIRIASALHDIGKAQVPSQILSKPSRLSEAEFSIIQAHPQVAYEILRNIDFGYPIARIVLQHHERLDGSGYPSGIMGDQIMFEAKVLAVADVIEAMVSYRPYRPAVNTDMVLLELINKKAFSMTAT